MILSTADEKKIEFSPKRMAVVYRNANDGNIKVEKWFMSEMYNTARFCGELNDEIVQKLVSVHRIIKLVSAGRYEDAQTLINETTDEWYQKLSFGARIKCKRNIFVER